MAKKRRKQDLAKTAALERTLQQPLKSAGLPSRKPILPAVATEAFLLAKQATRHRPDIVRRQQHHRSSAVRVG